MTMTVQLLKILSRLWEIQALTLFGSRVREVNASGQQRSKTMQQLAAKNYFLLWTGDASISKSRQRYAEPLKG